jgi:two-component system, chemotaxis family, chemotaxis protein CheY
MPHILIIDDNESFRASTRDLLEAVGYSVSTASDGADGVRQFQQATFDLVICDLFMPRKDGLETINDIRKLASGTPIIATSGYAGLDPEKAKGKQNVNYLRAAEEFGATHTLVKPFETEAFLALVRSCVENVRCPYCGHGAFKMITGATEGAECLSCAKIFSLRSR